MGKRRHKTTKQLIGMGYPTYWDYLQSPHWKKVRVRLLQKESMCRLCREAVANTLHHTRYDHLGCERDDDILLLCSHCHDLIHEELDRLYPGMNAAYKAERTLEVFGETLTCELEPPPRKKHKQRKIRKPIRLHISENGNIQRRMEISKN